MPARTASRFECSLSGWPPSLIAPSSARCMPNSVRASSVRPEPSRPTTPRTSPLRKVKLTSANSPRRDRPVTSSSGSAADMSRATIGCSISTPVISLTMRRWSTSATGQVPTLRPSRSTVTRSAIFTTSSSRWETKTTVMPSALSLVTMEKSRSTSARLSEEVGSSMNRSRARCASPRAMATIWRSATLRSETDAVRSRSKSRRCSTLRATSRILARLTGFRS